MQTLNDNPKITPLLVTITAVESLVLSVAGVGLLLFPSVIGPLWPWPIDYYHGRMYSVIYLTPATGAALLFGAAASIELLTMGLTQVVGGIIPIVRLLIIDNRVNKVDWLALGTWLWIGSFAAILLTGIGLVWRSKTRSKLEMAPADQDN